MSHIVTVQTRVHDPAAIAAACRRLGLSEPAQGTTKLYSGEATGLIVQLPDWQYPVVIDTATGIVAFDHFEGQWGNPQHFDRFLQAYAVEMVRLESRKKGYTLTEQTLQDGSIKLQIEGT